MDKPSLSINDYIIKTYFPELGRDAIKYLRKLTAYKAYVNRQSSRDALPVIEKEGEEEGKKDGVPADMPNIGTSAWSEFKMSEKELKRAGSEPHGQETLDIYQLLRDGKYGEASKRTEELFRVLSQKYTPLKISQKGPKLKEGLKAPTKKQLRRRRYSYTQQCWKGKNRSRLIRKILRGKSLDHNNSSFNREELKSFWKGIFEKESQPDQRPVRRAREPLAKLDGLITSEEIRSALAATNERAAGPDGVPLACLKDIGPAKLCILYNAVFCAGVLPEKWRHARTVLIPKSDPPEGPGDFRPITIGSYFYRLYASVIGRRIRDTIPIAQRQKGFVKTDGIRDNLMVMKGNIACTHCSQAFKTARALSAHKVKAHPFEWNEEKRERHMARQLKHRWTC